MITGTTTMNTFYIPVIYSIYLELSTADVLTSIHSLQHASTILPRQVLLWSYSLCNVIPVYITSPVISPYTRPLYCSWMTENLVIKSLVVVAVVDVVRIVERRGEEGGLARGCGW